jgi:hypothetical protein
MPIDVDTVTEILEYRFSQALPDRGISVKFVATTLKIRTNLAQPTEREIRSIFQAVQICRDNLTELPIQTVTIYGLRDNKVVLWKKSFPLAKVLVEDRTIENDSDLFSFENRYANRFAVPIAFLLSLLLCWTKLDLLLLGMRIWIHEIGHAVVAWFSGRGATPLPFGWTNVSLDRSPIVYICFLTLWGLLFYSAAKERKRWTMGIAVVAVLVQFGMTWFMSPDAFEMWFAFGGVGGEFYLSTLLVIGFYLPLPDRWHWGFWRYPALFMGASTFVNAMSFWHQIERGSAEIPWGTMLNGSGDAGGDMNQLHDLGWSDGQIINTYLAIGQLCLWVTIGIYVVRAIGLRRKGLNL